MNSHQPTDWNAWHAELTAGLGRGGGSQLPTMRPKPLSAELVDSACRSEWDVRPLGRLGRRLLPEVESYLEFFTIAHE
jgi:hypothetical protein